MNIDIPYNIGEHIYVNEKKKTIKGIHIYITKDKTIKKYRFFLGGAEFFTLNNIDEKES